MQFVSSGNGATVGTLLVSNQAYGRGGGLASSATLQASYSLTTSTIGAAPRVDDETLQCTCLDGVDIDLSFFLAQKYPGPVRAWMLTILQGGPLGSSHPRPCLSPGFGALLRQPW